MVLYVKYQTTPDDWTNEKTWHVGEVLPSVINSRQILEIWADGDELEFILDHFENIPVRDGRSCVWVGEMATFIWRNLGA